MPTLLDYASLGAELHFEGEDLDGIWSAWVRLQQHNRVLGCELFEGFVAKRHDSLYPHQLEGPERSTHGWMKHRFS